MSREGMAVRLAGKLLQPTVAGKLTWEEGGQLGPWGERPGQIFKAKVFDGTTVQIAEIPVQKSSIVSYYFGVAEGEFFKEVSVQDRQDGILEVFAKPNEIFGVFAEGYPADPTDEKLKLLSTLKDLFMAARDNVRGTWQKVEKFEQLLERLA
jgi:hypothetical protein